MKSDTHLAPVSVKLDDAPRVLGVVLDADDPHDVGRVLGAGVVDHLVAQDDAGPGLRWF